MASDYSISEICRLMEILDKKGDLLPEDLKPNGGPPSSLRSNIARAIKGYDYINQVGFKAMLDSYKKDAPENEIAIGLKSLNSYEEMLQEYGITHVDIDYPLFVTFDANKVHGKLPILGRNKGYIGFLYSVSRVRGNLDTVYSLAKLAFYYQGLICSVQQIHPIKMVLCNFVKNKRIEKVFSSENLNDYMQRIEIVLNKLNQIDQDPAGMDEERNYPSTQDEGIIDSGTLYFPVSGFKS